MSRQALWLTVSIIILVSCSNSGVPVSATKTGENTYTPPPTRSANESITPSIVPTSIPTVEYSSGHALAPVVPDNSLLFKQDFESKNLENEYYTVPWQIIKDETGNHILCNQDSNVWSFIPFGSSGWTNYAVEMRVKEVAHQEEQYVSLYARTDAQTHVGYYAALNFVTKYIDLQYSTPYVSIGRQQLQWISENVWYLMRLEVAGSQIKYYIDNMLVAQGTNILSGAGSAAFSTTAHLQVCVDDIRAWGLNSDGTIAESLQPVASPDSTLPFPAQVFTIVMANVNPDGLPSYEYKAGCTQQFDIVDTCFLWDLTKVTVETPDGRIIDLNKDFNQNSYSGEFTRRWVLYGPDGSGFPENGRYTFTYYKNDEIKLVTYLDYVLSVVTPVTNIAAVQNGTSLSVTWKPPADITDQNWYKVYVSLNRRLLYSLAFQWDAQNATLPGLSLTPGVRYEIDVDVFSSSGSSGGKTFYLVWKAP